MNIKLTKSVNVVAAIPQVSSFDFDSLKTDMEAAVPGVKVMLQGTNVIVAAAVDGTSPDELFSRIVSVFERVSLFGEYTPALQNVLAKHPGLENSKQFSNVLSAFSNFIGVVHEASGMSKRAELNNESAEVDLIKKKQADMAARKAFREQSVYKTDIGNAEPLPAAEIPPIYEALSSDGAISVVPGNT